MKSSSRGITFIEILIATAMSLGLMIFLSRVLLSSLRVDRTNAAVTDTSQNAESAAGLFLIDLKDAGYRGGDDDSFVTCSPSCSPSSTITGDHLGNLYDIIKWPFVINASTLSGVAFTGFVDVSGTGDPVPVLLHNAGTNDTLAFTRVTSISDDLPTDPDTYNLEYVYYSLDSSDVELTRLTQDIVCDGLLELSTSGSTDSNSICTLDGGNGGRQPAVDGVESLHFYFKLRTLDPISGKQIYRATPPTNISSVASIGVYLRARSDIEDFNFTDDATYPDPALLPDAVYATAGNSTYLDIDDWSDLGVPTEGPFNDNFRRVEKIQEIALLTAPACNLLPIAWPSSGTSSIGTEYTIPKGSASGNFGWVSWDNTTSGGTPELLQAINTPNLVSSTYINPNDTSDTKLDAGDGLRGLPGNRSPGSNALDQYLGIPVVLPVWDTVAGTGSNAVYNVTGFATILFTDVSSNQLSEIKAQYLGDASVTCTA